MFRLSGIIVAGLLANGCGGTGAVNTAPDKSQPRISWEIRTGGADGDDRTVCRSTDAAPSCALTSGAMVMLRLLFHPADRQTNYLGAWRAPFLQGWTEKDYRDVVGAVQPGEAPFRKAVNGIVTDKPGNYSFNVLLDAAQEGIPAGHRIVVNAPVVVTAPGAISGAQGARTGSHANARSPRGAEPGGGIRIRTDRQVALIRQRREVALRVAREQGHDPVNVAMGRSGGTEPRTTP